MRTQFFQATVCGGNMGNGGEEGTINYIMDSMNKTVNIDDEVVSETPPVLSGSVETPKKHFSNVWKYFTKTGVDKDGVERAVCKYCGHDYAIGKNPKTKNHYGTSHLSRHVSICKNIQSSSVDAIPTQDVSFGARKINQKTQRNILAQAIIKHDLPFNFAEYDMIREWINYVNPNVVMPSRNTVVSDVQKIYMREKEKLKEVICPNRVCLTSDVWTAATSEGYICLTVHFVDENWRLVSKILNFYRMKPPHTGVELEATLFDYLKQWGIDKKVFSITLDNASANDNMQDILKNHLRVQNSLLCDGEFFHVRSSAHILNLIIQEGLKVTNETLFKIRESVKYVRGSDGRMIKFQDCVQDAGIDTTIGLRLDVSTRWNSTYLIRESAIKYEKAFDTLQVVDRNYKYCLSYEEWRKGEKLCEFLKPFYETTNMVSGSCYPTSNLYFMQVWKIECLLNEYLLNEDDVIKDMATRMKGKFEKYWKNYCVLLAFGAILDPRLKLDFLRFCYTKLNPLTSHEKVNNVKDKFDKLYGEYANNFNATSGSQPSNESNLLSKSHGDGNRSKKSRLFNEFKMFQNETKSTIGKSKLDLYLDESQVDYDDTEEFNVLYYWKSNEKRFPTLSIFARDVLSIPITTVASESAFSIGGRVLTKYRSSTLPENVQMLICARNWLHGFVESPSDNDETKTLESSMQ
ncbi:zinc finger BED domain-containing protein RICESLEEPER 2-like [Abrus precatorius]|uniref:Zinc finger BED domain-containing protein RICESLEEPER 2-like n=1 Tax=Abrus precatorius TaxID=3816 RepID=A0A8B8MI62_ABRPR|nr:zinc finger BED domain-containing protein RICESLEEPER 2-like [Abrus precatorius]